MNRDEFIDGYMERTAKSGHASLQRTSDGFTSGKHRRIARPCACGEDCCDGWAMVSPKYVADHDKLYGLEIGV